MNSIVNVVHGFLVLVIDEHLDFVRGDAALLDIFFDVFASLVWGGVIDVDDMVVLVVLHENGVEVAEVQAGLDVFVGGDKEAETQLVVVVPAELVEGLVIKLFIIHDLPDGSFLILQAFIEGRQLNLNFPTKINTMHQLGTNYGSHVLFEGNLENAMTLSINQV